MLIRFQAAYKRNNPINNLLNNELKFKLNYLKNFLRLNSILVRCVFPTTRHRRHSLSVVYAKVLGSGTVSENEPSPPTMSWLDEEELAFFGDGEKKGGIGSAQEEVDAGAEVGGFDGLSLGVEGQETSIAQGGVEEGLCGSGGGDGHDG